MIRVILIRPGTTDYDEQRRIKGTLDIPLNEFGNDQIVRASNELADQSIEVVYSSPCQSAEETATVLSAALGIKTKTVEKFRNLDHGLWEGKLIEEVKATQRKVYRKWQEEPDSVCPPGGETVQAARQRVQTALEKILKKHKSGAIAVVVPSPLASIVRCQLAQGELGDLWQAENDCGTWVSIDVQPEQVLAS